MTFLRKCMDMNNNSFSIVKLAIQKLKTNDHEEHNFMSITDSIFR